MPRRADLRLTKTVEFLATILKNGPVPVRDVDRLAKAAGLLPETGQASQTKAFRSARALLGIMAFQRTRAWHWSLPETFGSRSDAQPTPSDARFVHPESAARCMSSQAARIAESGQPSKPAHLGPVHVEDSDPIAGTCLNIAAAIRRLDPKRPPPGIHRTRWAAYVHSAASFLREWGSRAAQLSWSPEDMLAIDAANPARCGLIWSLGSGRVLELDRDSATFQMPGGGQKIYRKRSSGADLRLPEL